MTEFLSDIPPKAKLLTLPNQAKQQKWLSVGTTACGKVAIGISAHGIVAIGVCAHGVVAIGVIAMGVFSAGLVSMGLVSTGLVAMGLTNFSNTHTEQMQPHHQSPKSLSEMQYQDSNNIHAHH